MPRIGGICYLRTRALYSLWVFLIGATPIGAFSAFTRSTDSVLSADVALAGSAFAGDGRRVWNRKIRSTGIGKDPVFSGCWLSEGLPLRIRI